MKKQFTLLMMIAGFITYSQVSTPTLYIGITSHNEMTVTEPYNTYTFYAQTRDTLKKIVDVINTKGAKYNLQTCQKFVIGCIQHEMAATTSTDILEYAYKLGGTPYGNVVEIDPRYKTQAPLYNYNIADVAHLIDSTGAVASNNLGGFVYKPFPGDWGQYTTTINGTFKDPWKANILWGAGTGSPLPLHSQDANNYGTWQPKGDSDSLNFYCHDPSKSYWLQGNGCAWVLEATGNIQTVISDMRNEIGKIRNGTYPSNKIYFASVMINFKDFQSTGYRAKLTTLIDSVNFWAIQGKVAWKTISQKHTTFLAWSSANSIAYSQWRCGQTATLVPTCQQSTTVGVNENSENETVSVAPNPANDKLLIKRNENYINSVIFKLYDVAGKLVTKQELKETVTELNVKNFAPGVYVLIVESDGVRAKPKKLVVEKN